MMDHEIIYVKGVCGPYFSETRHAATGTGWIVDIDGPVYADGTRAIHEHSVYATKSEAAEYAADLRRRCLQ